jgi:hypothetical protein
MTERTPESSNGLGFVLAFVDVVFNILLGVFILYWLAQLLINDPESRKVDTAAEYLVTLEWPTSAPHDIDLWVEGPLGNVVGYQSRDSGLMSLERDDLGNSNDTVTLPGGQTMTINENSEVITLRGMVPGKYKVSIHFYKNKDDGGDSIDREDPNPEDIEKKVGIWIKAQLIRVNPKYSIVYQKEATLERQGDEMAMFQFVFEKDENATAPHLKDLMDKPDYFVIMKQFAGNGRQTFERNKRYSVYQRGKGDNIHGE